MSPAANSPVPLTDVRVGSAARLCETRLDPASADLLRALGLTESCRLHLRKGGEPCIVQVGSTRIGLSMAVARLVYVIPEAEDAA